MDSDSDNVFINRAIDAPVLANVSMSGGFSSAPQVYPIQLLDTPSDNAQAAENSNDTVAPLVETTVIPYSDQPYSCRQSLMDNMCLEHLLSSRSFRVFTMSDTITLFLTNPTCLLVL